MPALRGESSFIIDWPTLIGIVDLPAKKPRSAGWKSALCVVAFTMACVQFAVFLKLEVWNAGKQFTANFGEGHLHWMAVQILDRHAAYPPIDRLPFVVYPYTPLYAILVHLLGGGDLLLTGRYLSVACMAALVLVLAFTTFCCLRQTSPLRWRLTSAVSFVMLALSMRSVISWTPLMRVDMLALLFSFSGFACFILLGRRQAGQYIAVIFFVLALFTKQTVLPIPAACFVAGCLADWRQTVRAYLLAVILGIASLAGLTAFYGKLFLRHTFSYNVAPFYFERAIEYVATHFQSHLVFVLIVVAAAWAVLARSSALPVSFPQFLRRRLLSNVYDRAILIGCLHFIFATFWMFSIGKAGADINYYLEWDIECAFVTALFVYRLLAVWKPRLAMSPASLLAYLIVPSSLLASFPYFADAFPTAGLRAQREESEINAAIVVDMIRLTTGPVFAEDMELALRAGKPLVVELASVNYMRIEGNWDEQPLVDMLEKREFPLLVVFGVNNPDRYSPLMAAAIRRNYQMTDRFGPDFLYRPRLPADGGRH